MAAPQELALPIDPKTMMLTQEGQSTLPYYALPTAGYLTHLIPGLNVDLKAFIGVWEGTTKVRGNSGFQQVSLRIECGSLVNDSSIYSTLTVVTPVDRIREIWAIEEGRQGIKFKQTLKVPGSVITSQLSGIELITSTSDAKIREPYLSFSLHEWLEYPNIDQVEKPDQFPILTANDVYFDRTLSGNFPDLGDAMAIPNDLRELILKAEFGIASAELRSRITQRVPVELSKIGRSYTSSYRVHDPTV